VGCYRKIPDAEELRRQTGAVSHIARKKAFRAGHYVELQIAGDTQHYRTISDYGRAPPLRSAEVIRRVHVGDTVAFLSSGRTIWQLEKGDDTLRKYSDVVRAYRGFVADDKKGTLTILLISAPIMILLFIIHQRQAKKASVSQS